MNEVQWLDCADPTPMLEFLRGKASDRKLRLFSVACCRLVWDCLTTHRSRRSVETAEEYADGLATDAELVRAYSMAMDAAHATQTRGSRRRYGHPLLQSEAKLFYAATIAHCHKPFLIGRLRWVGRDDEIKPMSPALLRDIFGNPFRPATINHAWLAWNDGTVRKIAQAIYDERAFDRLPILADALEDAGGNDENILNHCRSEGQHVRGCWVVDLVLGKE
jgi:hypothetical protein